MKRLIILLLLMPMVFAGWESTAAIAMTLSVTLLAIAYAVGFGFGIEELKIMAKEEIYQVAVAALIVAALLSTNGLLDGISTTLSQDTNKNMQEVSIEILEENRGELEDLFAITATYDNYISKQNSKTSQCNIQGIGYSVSGCGGYGMMAPPLSMAGGILGFAIGELFTMEKLIGIADAYALNLLLPLGIILRTLKITRGAGGFLMALAISMHIMLPIGVIFNEMLVVTFESSTAPHVDEYDHSSPVDIMEDDTAGEVYEYGCKPGDSGDKNIEHAINVYGDVRDYLKAILVDILLRGTLGPVLSLLLMSSTLRTLTSLGGAEVDVSGISRFI